MNVYVVLEQRFFECNGKLYTKGAFPRSFWDRYLQVFHKVTIVARALSIPKTSDADLLVSDNKVAFYPLPHYIGLKERVLKHKLLKEKLTTLIQQHQGVFILRVGSPIADILAPMLQKRERPYALEVVGDPWDVFAKGAIKHPLRPLLRLYFSYKLWQQCRHALFCSYVTKRALQNRYPATRAIFQTYASSIELYEEYFYERKNFNFTMKKWLFVGTLEQLQKAPDDLIKAFSLINDPNIKLTIIGDGRERQYLEHISKELGLTNRVEFIGHVKSPQEVRRYLLEHPFFVLPSRGEGLPRSMIEAMACQCITVGSNIGGIQELIDKEFTVNRNRPKELAEKIHAISNASPEWLKNTAINNQNKAHEYLWTKLNERRVIYYSKIKEYFQRINEDSSSG